MSNLFKDVTPRMVEVGLNEKEVRKEASFALQIINRSSILQKCSVESKQSALLNVAQTGLTLNPIMKLAYLVPRYDSTVKGMVCHLEPSYQGLVKLLTDTKSIETVSAQLVYANDSLSLDAANFDNPITHNPDPFGNRGDLVGAYAIAVLPSGLKQYETMSIDEVYEIRDRSESYKAFNAGKIKSCVWITDEGEMIRKTVIRRLVKYLPKSENFDKVAKVIELDERDYKPSPGKIQFAGDLLANSDIVERSEFGIYEYRIQNASNTELDEIIKELEDKQRPNMRTSATEVNGLVADRVAREK